MSRSEVTTPASFDRPGLWLAIGIGLIVATVWYSLDPRPPAWAFAFGPQVLHAGTYGLLTFWFGQLYSRPARRLAIAAGFIVMGAALEGLQGEIGGPRRMSLEDVLTNGLGVAIALALLHTPAGGLLRRIDAWLARPGT